MKLKFEVEFDIYDSEKETWVENNTRYHKLLYNGDMDKVNKAMSENTFEKAVAEEISDLIENYIDCTYNCEVKQID